MRRFDAYLAVDWSAKSTLGPNLPSPDSVWVGERVTAADHTPAAMPETYWRTRQECLEHLRRRLLVHRDAGRRVLLGCDFAYGYPAGFAAACGLAGHEPPWRRTWNELSARVEDDASARNNRFKVAADLNKLCRSAPPGPFWGGPATSEGPHFSLRDSPSPYPVDRGSTLQRLRETERRLPGVSPTWKLWGPGSVGGQTLLGIPAVARLRDDPAFQAISRVWPFETGFGLIPVPAGNPYILHIEIWPGVVKGKLDPAVKIKDQAQVRAMVKWLADLDAGDELLPLFSQPADLTGEKLARVRTEEGWIFGAR